MDSEDEFNFPYIYDDEEFLESEITSDQALKAAPELNRSRGVVPIKKERKLSQVSRIKPAETRRNTFSKEEKHILAAEVLKHNVVWDLTHELHSKTDAVNRAWKDISVKLGKPVQECKAAWTSLRESRRYRAKGANKKKSGDAGGEKLSQPDFDDDSMADWEYAKDLDFLPNNATRRRTFTTISSEEVGNESGSSRDKMSNYSYTQRPSTSCSGTLEQSNAGRISDSIEKFVEIQKSAEVPPQPPLVHYSLWANLDRMLQKLPAEEVEEVNYELTTILYNKIKKHQQK